MGREVVQAVLEAGPDLALTGANDPAFAGKSVLEALGLSCDITIQKDLETVLASDKIDALVVFCLPSVAMEDIRLAMKAGTVPVVRYDWYYRRES